jgi:hypothetical protein
VGANNFAVYVQINGQNANHIAAEKAGSGMRPVFILPFFTTDKIK